MEDLLCVLINTHNAAAADSQEAWHKLALPLQLLLHQEESSTIGRHVTTFGDVVVLGTKFAHGEMLAVPLVYDLLDPLHIHILFGKKLTQSVWCKMHIPGIYIPTDTHTLCMYA